IRNATPRVCRRSAQFRRPAQPVLPMPMQECRAEPKRRHEVWSCGSQQHAACQLQREAKTMNSPANSGNFASTDLPDFRQLPVFRQSTNVVCMPSSFDVLYGRERLRVGQLFLRSRPLIATAGGLANAAVLAASSAPFAQKRAIACALGGTILAFHWEAWSLKRRELTERWLLVSLAATLLALTGGALLSGGATSPFLPLFFAPVVVGYAAFARRAPSFL